MRKQIIQIDYGFICLLCLLYLFDTQNLFGVTLLAAALHESGHLFFIYLTGNRVAHVRLSAFGACIDLADTNKVSYITEAIVATGGPLFGVIGAVLLAKTNPVFAGLNVCLTLFNLLPIAPLDGGKIMRCVLCCFLQVDTVDQWMKWLGLLIGLFVAVTILILSDEAHCTIGMILFAAFIIRISVA